MAIEQPIEKVTPRDARQQLRKQWIDEPGFYNPWLHIGVTSILGIGLVTLGVCCLKDAGWTDVAFGFGLLLISNIFEWYLHQNFLHKRVRPFAFLYDQHTPRHHRIFTTDDMSIQDPRELRMVMMPAYAMLAAFGGLTPVMAAIWFGGHHNLAAVFSIETMGYLVSYEWLHLSFHLPEDSFIGRRKVIQWLKRHHAVHHDPRLMQKWNFNVTFPFWDFVRGTYVHDRNALVASRVRAP